MIEELQKVFEILDLSYDEHKDRQYQGYMEGILEWNEHVNLTAIKDRDEFIEKHYIDSLLCAGSPEFRRAKTIIDVGTGGGFPGIPLAVAFPEKQRDAPKGRQSYNGENDPAEHRTLPAEDGADKVEPEDSDGAPVQPADDHQRQRNFIQHPVASFPLFRDYLHLPG